MNLAKCAATVGLILAIGGAAQAINFDVDYQGPISMKFSNWDVGTLYDVQDGLYEGEAVIDAIAAQLPPEGAIGSEDTWGVFRLASITDPSGTIDLWNRYDGRPEVTGIFWGERDVYLTQTTVVIGPDTLLTQEIHGVGMSVAFFEDPSNDFDPFPAAGIAAERTAPGAFTTVTNGTLIWSMTSIPGHDATFPTHEFFTEFWPDRAAGEINAVGGFFAEIGAVDLDGDGIAGDVGELNDLIVDDLFTFEFTGEPDATGTWIVLSDDPIHTNIIPEPATVGLLILGHVLLLRPKRRP